MKSGRVRRLADLRHLTSPLRPARTIKLSGLQAIQ
jgi:hypothetical protein